MPVYNNVSGVWKENTAQYTRVSGVWREIDKAYTRVSGVWRESYSSGPDYSVLNFGNVNTAQGGEQVNIDDNRIVLYKESSNICYVYERNGLNWGSIVSTSVPISPVYYQPRIANLPNSNKFIITFTSGAAPDDKLYGICGEVNANNTITFGSPTFIENYGQRSFCVGLTSSVAIASYDTRFTSSPHRCCSLNISGTTISAGSSGTQNSFSPAVLTGTRLDDTRAYFVYKDDSNKGRAQILKYPGDSGFLTRGIGYEFSPNIRSYPDPGNLSVSKIDTNKVIVAFESYYAPDYRAMILISNDDVWATATKGAEYQVSGEGSTVWAVKGINSENALYVQAVNNYPRYRTISISGTVLNINPPATSSGNLVISNTTGYVPWISKFNDTTVAIFNDRAGVVGEFL